MVLPDHRPRDEPRSRAGRDGLVLVVTLAGVAVLLRVLRHALLPFVVAAAIAFVTDLPVRALQRRGVPRSIGGAALCVVVVSCLAAIVYWGAAAALRDAARVVAHAPEIARRATEESIGSGGIRIAGRTWTPADVADAVGRGLREGLGLDDAVTAATLGVGALFGVVLTLVLVPYFVISGPRLVTGTLWLLPADRRPAVETTLARITPMLRRYVIGLAVVVGTTAGLAWLGFGPLFHLPYAGLLAVTVGILELIPVVGPITSAAIVVLTALQQHTLSASVGLAVYAMALRFVIDNVVGPIVLGTAGRIHPVVVILSFICGAATLGILGLLLAVPTAAAVKIVLSHRDTRAG